MIVVREGTEGPYAGTGGVDAPRHPARDRHPGVAQHRLRRRAGRPLRLREGRGPAAQEADAGPQDQRAHLRRRPVGAHRRPRSRRSSPTSRPTTATSTPPRCSSSASRERFDVIVTDNLFGDIITDLGAAIAGGIGLAASGNINPERTAPSMFEPVHGSAPDIAGPGQGRPDRDHPVGRHAAGPPRPGRRGRPGRAGRRRRPRRAAGRPGRPRPPTRSATTSPRE